MLFFEYSYLQTLPFVVNKIGKEAFGAWAILGSFIGIAVVFDFGFGLTLEKEVARYKAKNEPHVVNNFLFSTIPIQILLSVVVVLLIYFALSIIMTYTKMSDEARYSIYQLQNFILLFALIRYFAGNCMGIVRGLEKHYILLIVNFIHVVLYVSVLIYLLPKYPNLHGLVICNVIASLFLLITLGLFLIVELKVNFHLLKFIRIDKSIFVYSINVFILQLCAMVLFSSGKIILGIVVSAAEVSYYEIGRKIFGIITNIYNSIARVLLPKASASQEKQRIEYLENLLEKGTLHLFAFWGALCIPIMIVVDDFITLWLGVDFASVVPIARLLIVSTGFIALSRVSLNILLGIGVIKRYSQIRVFFTIFYMVLAIFLTKHFGVIGLASSLLVYSVTSELIVLYYSFKKFKLNLKKFIATDFIKLIILQLLVAVTSNTFLFSRLSTSYISICIVFALFNLIYFIGYYLFILSVEDRKWLNNKISMMVATMK